MKVLLVNGGPHRQGCTFTALSEVAGALEKQGIDTETLWLGVEPVAGCIGCGRCFATGRCFIGDAVNEAARLCDLAKDHDGLVLASGAAVREADPAEAARWDTIGAQVVRGRDEPTELCVPR